VTRPLVGIGTFLVYAAVVVGLTWPLGAHLATHLPATWRPCSYDLPYMTAVLAHESRALMGQASFTDPGFFHPAPHVLFYGDTGFGALPFFFPVFLASGNPTLAINVVFLLGITLTATTLHLVVRRWTGSSLAGFVATATLLGNRWVLWSIPPSAPSYAMLQYLAPIVFVAAATRDSQRTWWLAPLVAVQCLTDVAYVATAVVVPLGLLGAIRVTRRSTRAAGVRLLAALGSALLLVSPVYAAHLAVRRASGDAALEGPWSPLQLATRLPWGPLRTGPLAVPGLAWLLIAAGALVFLLSRERRADAALRRPWLAGAFWAIVGFYISLGPIVVWGSRRFVLPHAAIAAHLGVYDVLRVPSRLGVAGLVGVAILAGTAFAECVRRLPAAGRVVVAGVVVGAMGVCYVQTITASLGAYPIAPAVDGASPLVGVLRAGLGPILELPLGARPSGLETVHAAAMYRAIFHGRPILNGYSSYWPPRFRERMALARRLPEPGALAALASDTGLATVVVHMDQIGQGERVRCALLHMHGVVGKGCDTDPSAAERASWIELATRHPRSDLVPVGIYGQDVVFTVATPTTPPTDH
jgi:hypothetical protein